MMQAFGKLYGTAFTVRLPFFGPTVVISDHVLVKQFFQTKTDVVRNVEPNLDLVLGPGSTSTASRPFCEVWTGRTRARASV